MSDSINDINNDIDAKIYVNPNGEITEPILNALLKRMATFTNDRLPLDGSAPMTGELNVDGKGIKLSEIAGKINRVSIVGDDVVFTGEDFIIISNLKGLKVDKNIEASGEIRSIDSAVVLQKTGLGKVSISTVGLTGDWEALFPNKNITVAGLDDITSAIAAHNPTLAQILTNGNDAEGQQILLNGAGASLTGFLGMFSTINAVLAATGSITLETGNNKVDFKGSNETLRHDISALDGIGSFSPIVATWQNKSITVAGLDDIAQAIADLLDSSPAALDTLNELAAALGNDPNFATTVNNAIAARLKLNGSTPMTGDLDMNTNNVAVKTSKIKTASGRLEWYLGLDKLTHDLSDISGGLGSYLQTWRAKAGTVAHLDDSHYYIVGVHNEDVSHMGTSEAVLATISIPANTYTSDDVFLLDIINGKINTTAGDCYVKAHINTTPDLSGTPQLIAQQKFNATDKSGGTGRKMLVRNADSLINAFTASNTYDNYYQRTTNTPNLIGSLDFTTDQYLVISGVSADANDGVVLHSCVISRLRKTD